MEAVAKQDLESRISNTKRCIPPDSTAGVSLAGLTMPNSIRIGQQQSVGTGEANAGDQDDFERAVIGFWDEKRVPLSLGAATQSSSGQDSPMKNSEPSDFSSMMFHFTRAGDSIRQDIVCMSDILDSFDRYPCW